MGTRHLFTALNSDGSGDYVMAIQGNPKGVERAVRGMPSVRRCVRQGNVTHVIFKGKVYEPLGMFRIIQARIRSTR